MAADEVLTVLGAGSQDLALVDILARVVAGHLEAGLAVAEKSISSIHAQLVASTVVLLALISLLSTNVLGLVFPVSAIIAKIADTFLRQTRLPRTAVELCVRVALGVRESQIVRAAEFVGAVQALDPTRALEVSRDAVAVGALELFPRAADNRPARLFGLVAAISAVAVSVANPLLVDAVALVRAHKGVIPTVRRAVYCLLATLNKCQISNIPFSS